VQIRTDDDVYRVDAVWLGPPRATFPWRARYSSYGVGLIVMVVVMFFQRRLGIPIGFFSVAWALLITVVVVRFVAKRIDEDRPLLEWLTLFFHELRGPRRRTRGEGSRVGTAHVQIEAARPLRALPAGRTDPHGRLAVPDRSATSAPDAPATRRPRRRGQRSWTTRAGRPAPPPPRTVAGAGAAPVDDDGVLHVTARRADRPGTTRTRPPRSRPASGPRRYGPSATAAASAAEEPGPGTEDPPRRRDEEGDGAAPARS
jgi:hypothetical protein